jgi:hypothetical protein
MLAPGEMYSCIPLVLQPTYINAISIYVGTVSRQNMKEKWHGTVDRDLDGPGINSEE